MAALVLLCGCGRSAEMSAEDVRAHFASLDSCTAHLKIISDIGGRISGEENGAFTLQYNDLQLDDIAPRHTGLTPADAWFCLLNDLRYAAPAQVWSEHTNGESLLVLRYEKADDSVEKQVWLRQSDLQPVYAELYADGARVLTIQVESCQ